MVGEAFAKKYAIYHREYTGNDVRLLPVGWCDVGSDFLPHFNGNTTTRVDVVVRVL